MRVLNTLYVTSHRAKLSTRKGSLLVKDVEAQTRIPMESLESVVLLGNASVTPPALAECAKRGIAITALTRGGRIKYRVVAGGSGNVLLRMRQLEVYNSPEASDVIARNIVAGKVQNSRRLVNRWMWDADPIDRRRLATYRDHLSDALQRLAGASTGDRIRGIEGDAARSYFRALSVAMEDTPFPFKARIRRPPRDSVNALLSFLYTLLTNEMAGALEAVGLDPQVGFLHRARPGRPSLALDLIEELRAPHVDRFVVRLLRRREISPEDGFTLKPGGACYLTDDGRRHVLSRYEAYREEVIEHRLLDRAVPRWSLPQIQATLLARHLRGDLEEYPPYLAAS